MFFFYQEQSQLSHILGVGIPLFFNFQYQCIILLIAFFISSGGYNLLSNIIIGEDCIENAATQQCQKTWITEQSLLNKKHNLPLNQLQNIMTLFAVIAVGFIFQQLRKSQRVIIENQDQSLKTRSDFTIIIKNIKIQGEQVQVRKILQKKLKSYIENVYFQRYQIDGLQTSRQIKIADEQICIVKVSEQKNIYWAFVTLEHEEQQALFFFKRLPCYLPNTMTNLKVQILENVGNNNFKPVYHYYQKQKQFLFKQDRNQEEYKCFKDSIVQKSYNPQEYLWDNIEQSSNSKTVISWIIFILAIIFSIIIIYYVSSWQQHMQERFNHDKNSSQENILNNNFNNQNHDSYYIKHLNHNSDNFNLQNTQNDQNEQEPLSEGEQKYKQFYYLIISQSVAWCIQALNFMLNNIMLFATKLERKTTKTNLKSTYAKKLFLLRFFNSTLLLFFLNVIFVWKNQGIQEAKINIQKQGGLVYNINMLLINTALKDPLVYLIGLIIGQAIKSFKIRYQLFNLQRILSFVFLCKRKFTPIEKSQKKIIEDQYLSMAQEYPIEERYAWLLSTVFLAVFYAPLIPSGFLWAILGITLMYWVEKIVLLYQFRGKSPLEKPQSEQMTAFLEGVLVLYCVSNLIFQYIIVHSVQKDQENQVYFGANQYLNDILNTLYDLYRQTPTSIWIGVGLGLTKLILPMQQLNEIFMPINMHNLGVKQPSYKQVQIQMNEQPNYYEMYKANEYLKKKVEIYKSQSKDASLIQDQDSLLYIEWPPEFFWELYQDIQKQKKKNLNYNIDQDQYQQQQQQLQKIIDHNHDQNQMAFKSLKIKASISDNSIIVSNIFGELLQSFYIITFKNTDDSYGQQIQNPVDLIQRQLFQKDETFQTYQLQ